MDILINSTTFFDIFVISSTGFFTDPLMSSLIPFVISMSTLFEKLSDVFLCVFFKILLISTSKYFSLFEIIGSSGFNSSDLDGAFFIENENPTK